MLKTIKQTIRLISINATLVRYGLDQIIFDTPLLRPLRFMLFLLPWNWFRRHRQPRAVRLRLMLEELGPIFVKFGQIVSTRRDLLPQDIADELARLQDHVAPFPGHIALQLVEAALEQPINAVFSEFDQTPIASASIAQVHAATLKDGSEVVVKVVRPGIKQIIRRDVGLMYLFARLTQRYWGKAYRLHPVEIVAEYEAVVFGELDLLREAASASQLRRNFKDSDLLYVPEIYWDYARRNVLVMGRISGIPINDFTRLREHNIDLKLLAERGVQIFFIQILKHNFFHADVHPGNIFVARDAVSKPRYIAVDFGIMGSLSSKDQRYLADNMLAFFSRDYRRVAQLHVESGWVSPDTKVEAFESAVRVICEPILERPLHQISFGHLLLRLFQTAHQFNMEVQPQLLLLQKTLLNVEGLGRQLYPDLDIWAIAKPLLEQWMDEQIGVKRLLHDLKQHAPRWNQWLPELPALTHEVLTRMRDNQLSAETRSKDLMRVQQEIQLANRRTILTVAAAGLLIAATLLLGLSSISLPTFADIPILSWALGIGSLVLFFGAWFCGRGNNR